MTKFKGVFWMGFTVVMLPIALVLMMITLTLITPKKENSTEVKTYYDTVKVKQKVIVYDTVKVIKEIKKKKEVKIEEEPIINDTLK
jgi:hypothetical protein